MARLFCNSHAHSFEPNFFRLEFPFKTKRKLKKASYVS